MDDDRKPLDEIGKEGITHSLSSVLQSMGEEDLTDEEKLQLLDEVYEEFKKQQYEYDLNIKFGEEDASVKDYLLSRRVLLDSLDKTKVMGEVILQMLASNPQNILLMETLQENIKLSQQSAKALINLHNDFTRNYQGVLRNKKLESEVSGESEDDVKKLEELMKKNGILFK